MLRTSLVYSKATADDDTLRKEYDICSGKSRICKLKMGIEKCPSQNKMVIIECIEVKDIDEKINSCQTANIVEVQNSRSGFLTIQNNARLRINVGNGISIVNESRTRSAQDIFLYYRFGKKENRVSFKANIDTYRSGHIIITLDNNKNSIEYRRNNQLHEVHLSLVKDKFCNTLKSGNIELLL